MSAHVVFLVCSFIYKHVAMMIKQLPMDNKICYSGFIIWSCIQPVNLLNGWGAPHTDYKCLDEDKGDNVKQATVCGD
jgi:hypothetical protein